MDPTPGNPGRARLLRWTAAAAVAALAWLAFAPALDAGFVTFDDDQTILLNERFRGFDGARVAWMFTARHMGHWQPLAWLSLAADHAVGGLDPRAYHRTNLALHVLNAVLVFALALRVLALARPSLRERPAEHAVCAAFAAAVFAAHPLRAETVCWVTERRDVLCAALLLGAALAWLSAVEPGAPRLRSRGAWAAALLLLGLSLLAKAWGMTFFVVLVLLDLWPLRRASSWRGLLARPLVLEKLPFAALGLAGAAVASWAIRYDVGTTKGLAEWSVPQRLGQAVKGLVFYVQKTLWPSGLIAIRELPAGYDPTAGPTLLAAALVAAAAGVLFLLRRRAPGLVVAACLYVVLISPVLGLQQAGPQFVADRYAYLACLPWALAAGALLASGLAAPRWRAAAAALALGAVAALVPLARAQARTWCDDESLWTRVLAIEPQSSIGNQALGTLRAQQGRTDEALELFRTAARTDPRNGRAWAGVGNILRQRRDFAGAEAAYRRMVETYQPRYLALVSLGNLCIADLGRPEEAIALYREAVRDVEARDASWWNTTPHLYLGVALARTGRPAEARPYLEIAARDERTRALALQELQGLR